VNKLVGTELINSMLKNHKCIFDYFSLFLWWGYLDYLNRISRSVSKKTKKNQKFGKVSF